MPYDAPPELAGLSLEEIAEHLAQRKLPPVESWNPQNTTDSLMRIAANGEWFHDGGPIKRLAMVRAFSGLLSRDGDGKFWLVTPYEKASILVEDAPFVAIDVATRDDALAFRLNTDEFVLAGQDHALTARGDAQTPALYLHVRRGLEARLNRSTYQQLAEIALAQSGDWNVSSQGQTFSLIPN